MIGVVGAGGAGEAAGGDDCPASWAPDPTIAAAPASAPFCRNSRRSSRPFLDFLDPLTSAPPDPDSGGYYHRGAMRRRPHVVIVFAAGLTVLVGCASAGSAPSTTSGLTGIVMR